MKTILLTLTILFTFLTTEINASISEETESILQTSFSHDKTFKKHARKVLRKTITDSDDQKKLMGAVALYRTGIQSANDLSKLFDLLARHVSNDTLDDFTSNLDTIIEAYRDNQELKTQGGFTPDRLKGENLFNAMTLLSAIQQKGFLSQATEAVVGFLTFGDFGEYLNFSRLYLVECFLTPLSKKSTWDSDLTKDVLKKLDLAEKEIGYIGTMDIGILYGQVRRLIEDQEHRAPNL